MTDLAAIVTRFYGSSLSAGERTRLVNALSAAHAEGYAAGYRHGTETASR